MPAEVRAKIDMTRIHFVNQLYGQEELARLQRIDARLMNTTMMVTLLGDAISDGLDTGQMVSGVGGQYNFVAMGHELAGGRSALMLRATRSPHGEPESNIVWNYGHTTIPRHLRDLVITEYGIADLRGQHDAEVIKRLLAIADSRFQPALLEQAKAHGKIEAGYAIPEAQLHNLPEAIDAWLCSAHVDGVLADFPFGSDFTEVELDIVRALMKLKHSTWSRACFATTTFRPRRSSACTSTKSTGSRTGCSASCSSAISEPEPGLEPGLDQTVICCIAASIATPCRTVYIKDA